MQDVRTKAVGDAVLQTAIQMEELGRDFYAAFAAATDSPKVRQLCLKLAADEQEHRKTFEQMHSELARQGRTVLLPPDQLAAARRRLRETVLPDPGVVRGMASRGDARALLRLAIETEQASVDFYRSLADRVPDGEVVAAIIREEQGHLRLLRAAERSQETGT